MRCTGGPRGTPRIDGERGERPAQKEKLHGSIEQGEVKGG